MDSQEDIQIEFGRRLRLLREHRGISQERLAIQSGLDRTYVSAIDRGKKNPTLVIIHKLAEALDVNPHFFLLSKDSFESELEQMPKTGIKVGRRSESG